ncbi:hypothetical protein [Algoriphagus sp.]|uniref:toxin-antitoxin system YwqK family antitoxin n=1 Tax=Algoriphagus sp. TaxID=1872435 RepID=UPI00329A715C
MKQVFLFFILFSSWTLAFAKNTECVCSTSDDLTIKQVVDADLVFRGTVIDQHTEKFPGLGYQYVAKFEVAEFIRGEYEERFVEVIIGYGHYCDPKFFRNTEYLVLTKYNYESKKYETSVCIGSRIWDESSTWNKASSREKRMIGEFQNGKFEHSWRNQFHQIIAKGKVIAGKPEGKWEFFNGHQKTEFGWFENGKKQGDWITFSKRTWVCDWMGLPLNCNLENFNPPHPEGWISQKTPFKDGAIHGTVLVYHESGCILSESIFEKGIQLGDTNFF